MIDKAIDHFQGSRAALCKAIGMSPQFLSQVYTGKRPLPPRFAVLIEEVTAGKVTAAELLPDVFSPRSTHQPSSQPPTRPRSERRERIYRHGDNAKERRAHLITETIQLARMADERGRQAPEDPSAARDEANYRVTYHTLSAELLAIASPSDAEEAKTQRENRQEHLKHADYWQRRLIELGGAA